MESSPLKGQMSSEKRDSPDVTGKVFVVRCHGLLECLVCGEVFTRSTAPAHAQANCCLPVEVCLLEPTQRSQ